MDGNQSVIRDETIGVKLDSHQSVSLSEVKGAIQIGIDAIAAGQSEVIDNLDDYFSRF